MEFALLKNIIVTADINCIETIGNKGKLLFNTTHHIFKDIVTYYSKYHEVPNFDYLTHLYEANKNRDLLDMVDKIRDYPDTELTNNSLVDLLINDYAKQKSSLIARTIQNKLIKDGAKDIDKFLSSQVIEINKVISDLKLKESKSGLLHGQEAIDRIRKEYFDSKNGVNSPVISNWGIPQIDNYMSGFTKSDLIFILGFSGQGKSTLMRNLGYNSIINGLNVMYIPLETSREITEIQFYTLHANNRSIFNEHQRIKINSVRDGRLTDIEENYFFNCVEDFVNNDRYGSLYIIQPENNDYSVDDLFKDIVNVHNTIMPIDIIMIDYITLLRPFNGKGVATSLEVNDMITRLKQFQTSFDGGNKVTIVSACQSSRRGYLAMLEDKEHKYNLTAISDFHNIERDSSIILSIARTDDDKINKRAKINCLKSREDTEFPQFESLFDAEAGCISGVSVVIDDDDKIAEELVHLDL